MDHKTYQPREFTGKPCGMVKLAPIQEDKEWETVQDNDIIQT